MSAFYPVQFNPKSKIRNPKFFLHPPSNSLYLQKFSEKVHRQIKTKFNQFFKSLMQVLALAIILLTLSFCSKSPEPVVPDPDSHPTQLQTNMPLHLKAFRKQRILRCTK